MTTQPDETLRDSLGYWVNRLALAMNTHFDRMLEPYGVTSPQWAVLVALHRGEAETPSELARVLGVDGSAVTRLLDRIEAKGLLVRHHRMDDRRSILLELTDVSRAMLPDLLALLEPFHARFLSGLDAAEIAQFRRTLQHLLGMAE